LANGTFNLEEIEENNRSVKEFISEYIENYSWIEKSPATVSIDQLSLKNLSEYIGNNMTLRLITENHALSLRKHLTTIYNPTTVNIRMRALKTAFNWALGDDKEYVDRNPFAKIKQIKVDKKAIRYLDPTQIKKFDMSTSRFIPMYPRLIFQIYQKLRRALFTKLSIIYIMAANVSLADRSILSTLLGDTMPGRQVFARQIPCTDTLAFEKV
jgi:hypothetical protein